LHVVAAVLFLVRPRVQLLQRVLPALAAMLPLGQALQVALLVREGTKPGLQQTQSLVPLAERCFLQDWQPALQPVMVKLTLLVDGLQGPGACATSVSSCRLLLVTLSSLCSSRCSVCALLLLPC
jgi:hypothetical protein